MRPPPTISSWCEIHTDRISKNLEIALGLLPKGAQFCAVLKADAYGHGIDRVMPLVLEQGVNCIGITTNAEARAVRQTGHKGKIIRLRAATPTEIDDALHDQVEEQVGSLEAASHLCTLIRSGQYYIGVHLALDASGMSRDGLEISTPAGKDICTQILAQMGKKIVGICSHFSSNDPEHLRQSATMFQQQVAWVFANSDLKRPDVLVHAGSSLTLVSKQKIDTDMYRCGAILYGVLKPELGFRPTMELKAHLVSLGTYPKGASVGYDRAKILDQDRRLACISIGYANGFGRNAYERSAVIIGQNLCPIVGKISMNTIVADVTDMPNIAIGDEVIVFGGNHPNEIGPDMVIDHFDTILADLYSDWGMRNQRIYC